MYLETGSSEFVGVHTNPSVTAVCSAVIRHVQVAGSPLVALF